MIRKQQIAAQLYSFRDFIKTVDGVNDTFAKLKKIGYDAVQLSSSLPPMPPEDLTKLLNRHGLHPLSSHESPASILDSTDSVIDKLLKLNCFHLAYPYPNLPVGTEKEVLILAKKLNETALEMKRYGITLSYHNHSLEFNRIGKKTVLELLYENAPDLEGEIDTFWVQHGGGNPVKWLERLAGKIQAIHIKDYGMKEQHPVMTSVGSGNLDWKAIFETSEKSGVKTYIVEHDNDTDDPFRSFRTSIDYLSENILKQK